MATLKDIISEYFPEEPLKDASDVVFNSAFGETKGLSSGKNTIEMVETENFYFFDVRPVLRTFKYLLSRINPIKMPSSIIILLMTPFLLYTLLLYLTKNSLIIELVLILTILGLTLIAFLKRLSIANILAVRKEWILTSKRDNPTTYTFEWIIPNQVKGVSLVNQLSSESLKKVSLFCKLQSGIYFPTFFPKTLTGFINHLGSSTITYAKIPKPQMS